MDFKEIKLCCGLDVPGLDMDQWRAVLNTVMKLQLP
jgi:hypothetical protein